MSKVVIIGDNVRGGLAQAIRAGFLDLGWRAELVPWGGWQVTSKLRLAYRRPRLAGRQLSAQSVDLANSLEPCDMVLVVKGPFFTDWTVEIIRRTTGAAVVCWNPDSPYDDAISNCGAGIPSAIQAYDLYVTWTDEVARLLARTARRVSVVPFGWDRHLFYPERGQDSELDSRVVFIGSWTKERAVWLRGIAHHHPVVFGDRWPPIDGVDIRRPAYGGIFRAAAGTARVALNFLRPQNRNSHNMRTFELLGCGAYQVAERSKDHELLLEAHGYPLFSNLEELDALLADPTLPSSPGTPTWLEKHDYLSRVRTLLSALGGI